MKRIEHDLKIFLNSLLQYTPEQKTLPLYAQTYQRIDGWIDELTERIEEISLIRKKLKDRIERLKKFRDVP